MKGLLSMRRTGVSWSLTSYARLTVLRSSSLRSVCLLLGGINYTIFATAGIVLQNAFSSAFQSGTAVVDDIKSGFLTKMLATPASRASILLGRLLSDAFRVFAQSLIILVLAYGLGVF